MKRSAVKKRTPQNKNKNTLVFGLLLVSVVTAVVSLLYFQSNKQNREHSNAQAAGSGWLSGASCEGVDNGSNAFGTWRGSPMTIAGTWNDNALDSQTNQWSLSTQFGNWDQSMDVSIGGIMSGTWADAANGSYDGTWHTALGAINNNWGNKKTIFIRFAHEFNGDWYKKWLVNADNNADYIKAFQRFHDMVKTDLIDKGRDAKVVWPPNSDDHNGIKATDSWPGDNYVDVVGVDYYDWDEATNQSKWDSAFNKTGTYGGPAGIGAWQAFAKAHGKPISFPEWGTTGSGPVDDPFFIQQMNNFFRTNAGTGPGQVWYEIYFNCTGYPGNGSENFLIYDPNSSNQSTVNVPQSAAMYKSLKWGDGGTSSGTTPAASQPQTSPSEKLITPSYGCVGGINCVPSSSPNPSETNPSSGVSVNPSDNPSVSPDTSISPSQTPGQGGSNNRRRGNSSFFQLIIQFFMQLIAFLLSLIGIKS